MNKANGTRRAARKRDTHAMTRGTPLIAFTLLVCCRHQATSGHDQCRTDAIALSAAVHMFHQKTGTIPSHDEGLEVLTVNSGNTSTREDWTPIVSEPVADPSNRPYRYEPIPSGGPPAFRIISLGQDGVPSKDDRGFSFQIGEVGPSE